MLPYAPPTGTRKPRRLRVKFWRVRTARKLEISGANDAARCNDRIVAVGDRKFPHQLFFRVKRNLGTRTVRREVVVATGSEEIGKRRWGRGRRKLLVWDTRLVTRITRYRGTRSQDGNQERRLAANWLAPISKNRAMKWRKSPVETGAHSSA